MKKFLFFYSVICLMSSAAIGQRFRVGVLGGIASSQVDGDTWAGYDKAGAIAGGFVTRDFSSTSKWSASFEITYIQKGSRKIPHPDKGDFASYQLKLNYAEVPLLLRYNFSANDSLGDNRMKFSLEGGIALGALVQSKEYDASGLIPPGNGVPFQKADYSVILGLNYFLSKHIGFDVRTEYSVTPVRKGGTGIYYQNWTYRFLKPGFYNNLLVFSLRYQL